MSRPWLMKDVLWLRDNYRKLGPDECATRLGRSHGAIITYAKRTDNCARRRDKGLPRKIAALYRSGYSDREIMDELGITRSSVRWWRQRRGHKAKNVAGTEGFRERLINLKARMDLQVRFERGLSDQEIASQLGLKLNTVTKKRRRMGLYRRPPQ